MIANYGYMDGSGEYYITIDTDKCAECRGKMCVTACPKALFERVTDDYDDDVVKIADGKVKDIRYQCMECKPPGHPVLPCIAACTPMALKHSW
ncbi:MAG: ferredoxin [Epsilonproteobacteria bacterium]|nr:ferredoxin [Campylobacterota bacterium]